jgi:hypothetical protein
VSHPPIDPAGDLPVVYDNPSNGHSAADRQLNMSGLHGHDVFINTAPPIIIACSPDLLAWIVFSSSTWSCRQLLQQWAVVLPYCFDELARTLTPGHDRAVYFEQSGDVFPRCGYPLTVPMRYF